MFFFNIPDLQMAQRWVIAYSGGVDSHVLLILAQQAARQLNKKIFAVHINHGLHASADDWQQHCRQICAELAIDFSTKKISLAVEKGESVEATAREARYQALSELLQAGDVLLTAHHQDDQAETVLLQLLRGAGVKGLAAIRQNLSIVRPLLTISRGEIIAYAEKNNLSWIHDDSNDNTRFDRNFLRHKVLPVLAQRWPAAKQKLARVADYCAEADTLLMELGRQDYQAAKKVSKLNLPDFLITGIIDRLVIPALLTLSTVRLKNALRSWLDDLKINLPSEMKLQHIIHDVLYSDCDAQPIVEWNHIQLRKFNNELYLCQPLPEFDNTQIYPWDLKTELNLPIGKLSPANINCNSSGTLKKCCHSRKSQSDAAGIQVLNSSESAKSLDSRFRGNDTSESTTYTIRFRQGGERLQLPGHAHSQLLKKLFQQWQIPPWLRDRIPLLFCGERLVNAFVHSN